MENKQMAEICSSMYPAHLYKTPKVRVHTPKEGAAPGGIVLYSPTYFGYCCIGGILSCGLTHTAVTPLDLVKCNTQANPEHFKGTVQGFRAIYSGQVTNLGFGSGLSGLVKGWGPTLWGYSLQGLFKFGLYELFKHEIAEVVGHDNATRYRDLVYLTASASAEFFADIALCPFEAVKVRIQTSPKYARGVVDGLPKMLINEGIGTLYAGIGPLWARQIPYTIIKFMAFERIAEFIYGLLPKKKEDMSKQEQMLVIFSAGYIAGVICGAVSHPADTMVSKINKSNLEGGLWQKMKGIYSGTPTTKGIGFAGLWAGFWPRVVMIGTLTGLQWFIYGAFKASVGLPTPGQAIKK
jgi:solute carrier family 25 phosphate transporter 3